MTTSRLDSLRCCRKPTSAGRLTQIFQRHFFEKHPSVVNRIQKKSHSGRALLSKILTKHLHGFSLSIFLLLNIHTQIRSTVHFSFLFLGTIEFRINWLLLSPFGFIKNHSTLCLSLTSTAHTSPRTYIPVPLSVAVACQTCCFQPVITHSVSTSAFEYLPSDSFRGHGLPREAHNIRVSAVKGGLRMRTAYSL